MFSEIGDITLPFNHINWVEFKTTSETENPTEIIDLNEDLFNFYEEPRSDEEGTEAPRAEEQKPYWKDIPMICWSPTEVLDFIKTEIIAESIHLYGFKCISGNIFKDLVLVYCQRLANSMEIGEKIYVRKENYIRLNPSRELNYHYSSNKENLVNTHENKLCDISNVDDVPKRRGRPKATKKRKKERSEKLWEFLLHLLENEEFCPEIIKWENYREGTFKFVKTDIVASLWGRRNNNSTMNYEKLTRAMRYHYKRKVLLPVRGKRLVYKFGPCAEAVLSQKKK